MQIINLIEDDSPILDSLYYPFMSTTKKLYQVFLDSNFGKDLFYLWYETISSYKKKHNNHISAISNDNIYEEKLDGRFTDSLRVINQIPIFLVNSDMADQIFEIDFLGFQRKIRVPKYIFRDNKQSSQELYTSISEEIDIYKSCDNNLITESINKSLKELNISYTQTLNQLHLSFCYDEFSSYIGHKEYEQGVTSLNKVKPIIFIWVDKIKDFTEYKNYSVFFSYSLIHSIIHALLDIQLFGLNRGNTGSLNFFPRKFHAFIEEIIVTGYTLMMMENIWSEKDIDVLINYLNKKSIIYNRGVALYNCKSNYNFKYNRQFIIETYFNLLLDLKLNQSVYNHYNRVIWKRCYETMKELSSYCLFTPVFDSHKLELYKLAFPICINQETDEPTYSNTYNGNIYSPEELVYHIVSDWVFSNPDTTRAQLKSVFPPSLNTEHDVFAEEWEFDKLKKSGTTGPVYRPEYVIECSDGILYLCCDWSFLRMHDFLQKAQELGFNITKH